jgi:hypothetical protein
MIIISQLRNDILKLDRTQFNYAVTFSIPENEEQFFRECFEKHNSEGFARTSDTANDNILTKKFKNQDSNESITTQIQTFLKCNQLSTSQTLPPNEVFCKPCCLLKVFLLPLIQHKYLIKSNR